MLTVTPETSTAAVTEFMRSFPAEHEFFFGMLLGFILMRVRTLVLRHIDARRLATGGTPILPMLGVRPRGGDMRTRTQRVEDAQFMAITRTYHREQ